MSKLHNPSFRFECTLLYPALKELEKLDPKIPGKVIKLDKDIVAFLIRHNFNNSLPRSPFFTT